MPDCVFIVSSFEHRPTSRSIIHAPPSTAMASQALDLRANSDFVFKEESPLELFDVDGFFASGTQDSVPTAAQESVSNTFMPTMSLSKIKWPKLEHKGAGNDDVQDMAFAIWCGYKAYRTRTVLGDLGAFFAFCDVKVPIFKKPPEYKGRQVQFLELEIQQTGRLSMERAVCVVDKCSAGTAISHSQLGGVVTHKVSFGGPKARTLHADPFHDGHEKVQLARLGSDSAPGDSTIKAWRFDAVKCIEDKADWYICVYMPYRKQTCRKRQRSGKKK